tara:strand:+ start:867 stop:3281 length:2415 start_codon:yes stop_codon:yes gene_type:complete
LKKQNISDITKRILDNSEKFKFTAADAKKLKGATLKKKISRPSSKWDEKDSFFEKIKDLEIEEQIEAIKKKQQTEFDDVDLWIERGKKLIINKKPENALECFNTALIKEPKNLQALLHKSFALQNLDKWEVGIDCLKEIIEIDDQHPRALFEIGYSLIQLQEYEEAIKYFEKSLKYIPDEKIIYNLSNIGYCNYRLEKYKIGKEFLERALERDENDEFTLRYLARCNFFEKNNVECMKNVDILIQKKTKDWYAYYMKGKILLDRDENFKSKSEFEDWNKALFFFKEGLKLEETTTLLFEMGVTNIYLEKDELSLIYFQRCVEIEPIGEHYRAVGNALYNLRKYDEALESQKIALQKDPENIRILSDLLECIQEKGKYRELINYFWDHAVNNLGWSKKPDVIKTIVDIPLLETLLTAYYNVNEIGQTMEFCSERLIELRGNVNDECWKAWVLKENKKFDEALKYYNKIIEKFPNEAEPYRLKGVFLREIKEFQNLENSLECFEIHYKICKENNDKKELAKNFYQRSRTLKEIGSRDENDEKFDEAIEILQSGLEIEGMELKAMFWREIGKNYWNLKNYDACVACFERSLEEEVDEFTWIDLGDSLVRVGTITEAKIAYNQSIKLNNKNFPSEAKIGLAKCLIAQNDFEEAIKECNEVIDGDYPNFDATFQLARAYHGLENFDESQKIYLSILREWFDGEDHTATYFNMGLNELQMKNPEKAISYAKKSLEINKNYTPAFLIIGWAYEDLEEYHQSIETIEENLANFNKNDKRHAIQLLIRCNEKIENFEKMKEYQQRLDEFDNDS